ncbi:hypothetical protein K7432_012776 [Basidiobolus ranarum]|uniref:Uncharacterized protein n=1 Tax=Basidiobolus ranarum TaxID=34480 RepID=A0ABR2WKE2_9FUNG
MKYSNSVFLGAALSIASFLSSTSGTYSSSMLPYSPTFKQPDPPVLEANFFANYMQHKWDKELSHISSGAFYVSFVQKKVRVDLANEKSFSSSLFNYNNQTKEGLVSNKMFSYNENLAKDPTCMDYYVEPSVPLFPTDVLISSNGVYAGLADDPIHGQVQVWNILHGNIPVSIFLDHNNTFVRYDFWTPNRRTFTTTRFFNIKVGDPGASAFEFPCK